MTKECFNPDQNFFIEKYLELKSCRAMSEYFCVNYKTICSFAKKIGYKNTLKKDISWSPSDKQQFIEKYNELKSAQLVADYYEVCKKTVLKYAKKINYTNQYRPTLTQKEIQYILDNYHLKKAITLAIELGVSKSLITKIWRENGLKHKQVRRYYINEDYFEQIDDIDKAYFSGVIAADGCVYSRNNDNNKLDMLSLSFNIQEKEIIDKFLNYTQGQYIPYIRDNVITLQVNSNKMTSDLRKYNIVERKTWIYKPYELGINLMWHYFRGYFDGDGSVYLSGKELPCNWFINLCGNKETIDYFYNFLKSEGINSRVYQDSRKDKYKDDFYYLTIRKNQDKIDFINKLYKDSKDLYLSRKYLKCQEFLKLYELRHPN